MFFTFSGHFFLTERRSMIRMVFKNIRVEVSTFFLIDGELFFVKVFSYLLSSARFEVVSDLQCKLPVFHRLVHFWTSHVYFIGSWYCSLCMAVVGDERVAQPCSITCKLENCDSATSTVIDFHCAFLKGNGQTPGSHFMAKNGETEKPFKKAASHNNLI